MYTSLSLLNIVTVITQLFNSVFSLNDFIVLGSREFRVFFHGAYILYLFRILFQICSSTLEIAELWKNCIY